MNQADIQGAAKRAAQQSKSLIGRQVDRQATLLGSKLSQTGRDLEAISSQLSQSEIIGGAAEFAERAGSYVERAGRYLQEGNTDQFITDIESFSRERPWVIAASAAALGFVTARIVKSSSARRFAESGYGIPSGYGRAPDYSAASPFGSAPGYGSAASNQGATTSTYGYEPFEEAAPDGGSGRTTVAAPYRPGVI